MLVIAQEISERHQEQALFFCVGDRRLHAPRCDPPAHEPNRLRLGRGMALMNLVAPMQAIPPIAEH